MVSVFPKHHVANASGQTMYVKASAQEIKVAVQAGAGFNVNLGAGGCNADIKAQWEQTLGPGDQDYFRLADDNYIEVCGDFISVFTIEDHSRGKQVCLDFKVPRDRSVIITADPGIVLAWYGKIWKNDEGRYCGNRVCGTCEQSVCKKQGH